MTTPTQPPPQTVTPAQMAALLVLIDTQARLRGELTRAAVSAVLAAFAAVTNFWDPRQTTRAITQAVRIIQPYQRQAARLTAAYVARSAGTMTGRAVRPAGAIDVTRLRRAMPQAVADALAAGRLTAPFVELGEYDPVRQAVIPAETINEVPRLVVPDPYETPAERAQRRREGLPEPEVIDPADPYGRVADQARYLMVTKAYSEEKARKFVLARVSAVAETDITLAVREQDRQSGGDIGGITGYRRILRPELSTTGPCGLCVVAADRIYSTRTLKEIHLRCRCEVLPIIGSMDPGLRLNYDELKAIYTAAGGTSGRLLKRVRVAMAEHAELGPVLVDADQHYRGPREVAVTKTTDLKTKLAHQLDGWEQQYAALIRRRETGADVERQLDWQSRRIEELRRELASL